MARLQHTARVVRAALFLGLCLQAVAAMAYSVTIKDASVTSTPADGDASTEPLTFPRLLPETLLLTPETDVTVAFNLVNSLTGEAAAPQQVRLPDPTLLIPPRTCVLHSHWTTSSAATAAPMDPEHALPVRVASNYVLSFSKMPIPLQCVRRNGCPR